MSNLISLQCLRLESDQLNTQMFSAMGILINYGQHIYDTRHNVFDEPFLNELSPLLKAQAPKAKVALLSVNTGGYDSYFDVLYESRAKNFLPDCQVTHVVYTDSSYLKQKFAQHNDVIIVDQQHYGWPDATAKRFEMFVGDQQRLELLQGFDFVFFANANAYFKNPVWANELLNPVISARNPYLTSLAKVNDYQIGDRLDYEDYFISSVLYAAWVLDKHSHQWEDNPKSQAYIEPSKRQYYCAGGFYGGTSKAFIKMALWCAQAYAQDRQNNIMPIWHDESIVNSYLANVLNNKQYLTSPGFCIPQEYELNCAYLNERDKFKIVYLNKNAIPAGADIVRHQAKHINPKYIKALINNEHEFDAYWVNNRYQEINIAQQAQHVSYLSWSLK